MCSTIGIVPPRDVAAYNKRYYELHRDSELARVKRRHDDNLRFLRDLRRVPCNDCGESFERYLMDFDHRKPSEKSFGVANGRALLKSRAALIEEAAKCDIVCANCHALRTYAQLLDRRSRMTPEQWAPGKSPYIASKRRRWRANLQILNEMRDVPCADCGRRFLPCVMQFDHRDPLQKEFVVTRIIHRARSVILAEAAKCDIVCTNCHRERTYQRRLADRAGVVQSEERDPSKVDVAGSNPVSRSELQLLLLS